MSQENRESPNPAVFLMSCHFKEIAEMIEEPAAVRLDALEAEVAALKEQVKAGDALEQSLSRYLLDGYHWINCEVVDALDDYRAARTAASPAEERKELGMTKFDESLNAIGRMFNDKLASRPETVRNLQSLKDEIDILIDALESDEDDTEHDDDA